MGAVLYLFQAEAAVIAQVNFFFVCANTLREEEKNCSEKSKGQILESQITSPC